MHEVLKPFKDKITRQVDWKDKIKQRIKINDKLEDDEIKFILNKIIELLK